jgi:hypothetical protein
VRRGLLVRLAVELRATLTCMAGIGRGGAAHIYGQLLEYFGISPAMGRNP